MKADYVYKDTLTATDYVELNKNNELLMSYNQALLKENQKYKEVIDKAIEYVSNKKAIINTGVIRIFDLFEIDEQGYIDELLDILKEVE